MAAAADYKTGETLDFVIPKPNPTVDLPNRQKSPLTRKFARSALS